MLIQLNNGSQSFNEAVKNEARKESVPRGSFIELSGWEITAVLFYRLYLHSGPIVWKHGYYLDDNERKTCLPLQRKSFRQSSQDNATLFSVINKKKSNGSVVETPTG